MNAEVPEPTVDDLKTELLRLRTLTYLFLSELQKVTGATYIGVPIQKLVDLTHDATFYSKRDTLTGDFRFWVKPPEPKVVAPSNRIVTSKDVLDKITERAQGGLS
jgi:hypothetical protein